jgi:hypothetical protein
MTPTTTLSLAATDFEAAPAALAPNATLNPPLILRSRNRLLLMAISYLRL